MMKPYYEQDGITIYHGDCRDVLDVSQQDEWSVVTDPPYGTGQKIAYDVYRDYMPQWLELMAWLLELRSPMAFTMAHTRLHDLPKRPQWIGCWDKVYTGGIVHVGACPSWEPICFYNLPAGDRGKPRWDDIFRVPTRANVDGHPCPKPLELFSRLIRVLPKRIVVDPVMGSGTTLRAAKDMGLAAIGSDVSERYCELAAKRLQQAVLPMVGHVHSATSAKLELDR
jgi:tRNA G10  N-methylase Trm11